jgi:hypothetical protein
MTACMSVAQSLRIADIEWRSFRYLNTHRQAIIIGGYKH